MISQRNIYWIAALPALMLAAVGVAAVASPAAIPNTFLPNTVADANAVNANFQSLKTAIDDNDSRITTLEGAGRVLAGAHVNGVPAVPTVSRSFNNVNGVAVTVTRIGVGLYEVDFGFNVSNRYYHATSGDDVPSGVPQRFFESSPRLGNPNALWIDAEDFAGADADAEFFVTVY